MRMVAAVLTVSALVGSLGMASAADAGFAVQNAAAAAARAIASGNADSALPPLQNAMRQYPRDPDVDLLYGQMCEAYLAKKNDTVALSYCAAAILRNHRNPRPYYARAVAEYRLGLRSDARRDVDAALALGAQKPALLGLKARLLWEDGALREARTLAARALARNSHEENARFVLSAGKRRAGEAPSIAPLPRTAVPTGVPLLASSSAGGPVPRAKPAAPVALAPDCAHPIGAAAVLICRDARLREADSRMQQLFARVRGAVSDDEAFVVTQRAWVAARRDVCTDQSCLGVAYSERMDVLGLWTCD